MIGFMAGSEVREETPPIAEAVHTSTPVKSLVRVCFENHSAPLAYYNDRFDLHEGDVVYVSGKLAGVPGVVLSVTTRFRIHTSDYERVLALLDLTFHGSFTRVQDKMVSFRDIAISPDQFGSWVTPPEDPRKKQEEDPDEVISGEGYTIDINNIEACEDITSTIAERAVNYCSEGRVRYLCIQDGVGRAYVVGSKWYRVDFRFSEGMMTDIYCDCPYSELCKHEVAVAITLKMLFKQPQFKNAGDFMALDRWLFWQLASRAETIDI
jgi:hypothetical protein